MDEDEFGQRDNKDHERQGRDIILRASKDPLR